MRWHTRRLLLPVALTISGVLLLVGCFPWPGGGTPEGGPDPRPSIGERGSGRLLEVGSATTQQVRDFFGDPQWISPDGAAYAYRWQGRSLYWVFPLCFMAYPEDETYMLTMEFDVSGRLKQYRVTSGGGTVVERDRLHLRRPRNPQRTFPPFN